MKATNTPATSPARTSGFASAAPAGLASGSITGWTRRPAALRSPLVAASSLSVALLLTLLAGPADAAVAEPAEPSEDANKVRYNRSSGKVAAKATLDTKFKKEVEQQEKEDKRQVNMMSSDDFARKRAAVAREVADKQIEMLKRLISATEASDAEYPDLLFRWADHYLEKKAYFDLQAGALYDQIYAAEDAGKTAEKKQLEAKQNKFLAESKTASEDAIKVYKALVSTPAFAQFPRMDEALYFYAFELGQVKREAEMKDAYLRLIREYPQSQYIPNAYLSFADFYFGKNQIQDALKLYQKIVDAYKDSPVYAYALYKMAWCYLNPVGTAEPEYAQSLQKFVQTVDATLQGRAGSEANAKQLRRDARRDLVKAYVHAGKTSKAWEFFTKVGDGPTKDEDMARKMMELLAVSYFGNGMYVESTATYKELQKLFPEDADRCEWQGRIVINALASDDKGIQWQETDRLGQYWGEYKDSNFSKKVKRKCRDEALDTIKQMATVWHDEAEKTRKPDTYALSENAYRAFLTLFSADKDAYEMQYWYCEVIWAQATNLYASKDRKEQEAGLAKFLLAHQEFRKGLEMKPDGKYTQDMAYAQMLAMKNHLEYDETGGQSKACKVNKEGVCVYAEKQKKKKVKASKEGAGGVNMEEEYPPSDYTAEEQSMLEAYTIYEKYVKKADDEELPKIAYHRVKLMMDHNRFDEAKPILQDMVVKFDGTIYAAWASEMLLDLLTIRWLNNANTPEQELTAANELEEWSKKLQGMKVYKHKEADRLREAIPNLLAGIGWKRGLTYQKQGVAGDPEGFVKCGQQFVQLFNDYDDHEKADILLFNAARCFEAAYLIGQSIKLRNTLLETFPDSEKAQQTLLEVAGNYQAIAYFEKSAEKYEQYATKYRSDAETANALQNAYLFRLGLGEDQKAVENLTAYEDLYKKKNPEIAAKIFWSRYELLDKEDAKVKYARDYLKTYGTRGGFDRAAVAEAAIGQTLWRNSCDKELLYDSCMTITRKKANAGEKTRAKAEKLRAKGKKKKEDLPTRCGSATQGVVKVYSRNKKEAAEAQEHFRQVLKNAAKVKELPADDPARVEAYKNAQGMALVYAMDEKYEKFLTIELPEELSFFVEDYKKDSGMPKWEKEYAAQVKAREESVKRLTDYFQNKDKLAAELVEGYAKVKETKSPFWTLAAAARSAIVFQNYADQLYRADVPKELKTEDQVFAYCDELAIRAEPYEQKALEAFTYCLDRSTEFQFFNEFSRLCEEELQQRDPEKYPATNELYGTSVYTDSSLDNVGVLTSVEGEEALKPVKKTEAKPADEAAKKDGDSADAATR